MEETDKQGYEAIQSNCHRLTQSLDPNDVLDLCFQRKLVSDEQMAEIEAIRETKGRYRACGKLLQALRGNGNKNVFQTFLEVLESKDHLKYLADHLRGKCGAYTEAVYTRR